jgi:hypothetical protein
MNDTGLVFHVRLKSDKSLFEIAESLENRLGFKFKGLDKLYLKNGSEVLYAEILGLRLTLGFNTEDKNDKRRACQFGGNPNYNLVGTGIDDYLDIGKFIFLALKDDKKNKWYIPTKEEYSEL